MTASTSSPPRARSCLGILLAAGEGVRMRSARAKPLHEVAGRSMLAHALAALVGAGAERIAVVVGPERDAVAAEARRHRARRRNPCSGANGAARRTPCSPRARRSGAAGTTCS